MPLPLLYFELMGISLFLHGLGLLIGAFRAAAKSSKNYFLLILFILLSGTSFGMAIFLAGVVLPQIN